jgi:hypothetical protein
MLPIAPVTRPIQPLKEFPKNHSTQRLRARAAVVTFPREARST